MALSDPEFRAATDTIEHEFYQVAFRKTLYHSLDQLQQDLDAWLDTYSRAAYRSRQDVLQAQPTRNVRQWDAYLEGEADRRRRRVGAT